MAAGPEPFTAKVRMNAYASVPRAIKQFKSIAKKDMITNVARALQLLRLQQFGIISRDEPWITLPLQPEEHADLLRRIQRRRSLQNWVILKARLVKGSRSTILNAVLTMIGWTMIVMRKL
jgi:hypothetical protein